MYHAELQNNNYFWKYFLPLTVTWPQEPFYMSPNAIITQCRTKSVYYCPSIVTALFCGQRGCHLNKNKKLSQTRWNKIDYHDMHFLSSKFHGNNYMLCKILHLREKKLMPPDRMAPWWCVQGRTRFMSWK